MLEKFAANLYCNLLLLNCRRRRCDACAAASSNWIYFFNIAGNGSGCTPFYNVYSNKNKKENKGKKNSRIKVKSFMDAEIFQL